MAGGEGAATVELGTGGTGVGHAGSGSSGDLRLGTAVGSTSCFANAGGALIGAVLVVCMDSTMGVVSAADSAAAGGGGGRAEIAWVAVSRDGRAGSFRIVGNGAGPEVPRVVGVSDVEEDVGGDDTVVVVVVVVAAGGGD